MARSFISDGGDATSGINPVFIEVDGSPLLEIFPLNYNYKNQCALLGSPAETGMTQYDHKVIQPSTVVFTGIIKWGNFSKFDILRGNIKSHKLDNILCTFYTKSAKAEKMIINYIEEVGESTRYDGVEVKVSLTEFLEHNVMSN